MADKAKNEWKINYPVYGNDKNSLGQYLGEKKYLQLELSGVKGTSGFYKIHPEIKKYKNGIYQPGLLYITREKEVLYSWVCNPNYMNLAGAKDRPVPMETWEYVQKVMKKENVRDSKNFNTLGLVSIS